MSYGLTVKTPASGEAVTIEEVKARARVDFSEEDGFMLGRIRAAQQRIEADLGRCLLTTTLIMTLDRFPPASPGHAYERGDDTIILPRNPVQSVAAVRYLDTAGDQQTLDASKYRVDVASIQARVTPAPGTCWPVTCDQINAVEVEFVAGYGATPNDVPQPIRDAIAILVATWHGPGRFAVGTRTQPMPMSVDYLLGPYRVGYYPGD